MKVLRAAIIVALVCSCVACARPKAMPRATGDVADEGVFRPASIRVHPLTRIVRSDDDALVIEAHVELFDAWGHPVKGLGRLRFEVTPSMPGGIGDIGDSAGSVVPTMRAEIDLSDPDSNSVEYYDSATRTYRLILEGGGASAATNVSLAATFIGLDGRVYRDVFNPGEGPRMSQPVAESPEPGDSEEQ